MPGAIGIAETAILGSTLHWSLQTEDEHPQPDAWLCWHSSCGYRVMSSGDNPRYWTALDARSEHVAAGAGDMGLAKCIRACERHAISNNARVQTPANKSPTAQSEPCSNDDSSPQR